MSEKRASAEFALSSSLRLEHERQPSGHPLHHQQERPLERQLHDSLSQPPSLIDFFV